MPSFNSDNKPTLLCEGFDPSLTPAAIYVRQAEKVFFVEGKPNHVSESIDEKSVVESIESLELVEDARGQKSVKDGHWFVEGPFQRADVVNANRRIYSRALWEKLIAKKDSYVQEALRDRSMIGHNEHPRDGRTDLKEAALLTTGLSLKPDGVVWGTAELLDTPNGRILQELSLKKVKWGVSSRGTGTVDANGQVSESDYRLTAFDAVAAPSTPGAYPKLAPPSVADSADESTAESTPALSSVDEACLREIDNDCSVLLESLTGDERAALINRLCDHFGRAARIGQSTPTFTTPTGKRETIGDVLSKLSRRLADCVATVRATPALTESADDSADDHAALLEKIELLQEQLEQSRSQPPTADRSDTVALARRVRERGEKLNETVSQRDAAIAERDDALSQLGQSLSTICDLKRKLSDAESRLSSVNEQRTQMTQRRLDENQSPLADYVNALVQKHPSLNEFAPLLSQLRSVAAVNSLANRLTTLLDSAGTRLPPALPVSPRGMVVESASFKPRYNSTGRPREMNTAADLAAAAVAQMRQAD